MNADARSGRVRLLGLTKSFGGIHAVRDLTLDLAPGEFVTFLGPSGSGKTTVLMMIAGHLEPTAGRIWIGDTDVTDLPPRQRDLGVVFQSYALFPHLTAAENIAFPLRMRRVGETTIRKKVREVLSLIRLPDIAMRMPSQLSGGQQQRVALARALVFDPLVLLLDEPLSALDKNLRESMQLEIRELHRSLGLSIIHVTHDQSEALAMSDRIVVMHEGQVVQSGTPRSLYEHPASRFVADFLGTSNSLRGHLEAVPDGQGLQMRTDGGLCCRVPASEERAGDRAILMIRPERIFFGEAAAASPEQFAGRITEITFTGELVRYRIALSSSDMIDVTVQNRRGALISQEVGSTARVGWALEDVHVFSG